jgi:hypothetical protein
VEFLESRDLPSVFHTQLVRIRPNGDMGPLTSAGPTGLSPAQVRHAYGFDQVSFQNGTVPGDGRGTTIAIVDAYDDPNIANDLHQFDVIYGLPDPVFTKMNENGGGIVPTANGGWSTEIALDVEWAHAIAPAANILLVEANSNGSGDLYQAVRTAARQPGVVVVSMSWGGGESAGEAASDATFTTPGGHPGVTFLASSGDRGAPDAYPSASPNVVSVGGTTLSVDGAGNLLAESVWGNSHGSSGGGVSAYEPQPSYQKGVVTQTTTNRANPDVAYDADPVTGFGVYDSYNNGSSTPWGQWGGTSDAAPQWAALVAIADQGRALAGLGSLDGPSQTLPALYGLSAADFHDITTGSSLGTPNEPAGPGYDLATGRGSPVANLVISALSNYGLANWTGWTALGGPAPATAPATARQADGVQQLAAIGPNGNLWLRWTDTQGDITPWYDVGGTCKSIALTTNDVGLVDAFAVFGDGTVWEFAHSSPSAFNWVQLGGSAAGPIAAATEAGGAEQVCSVGADGGLWVRWLDAQGHSTVWYDMGGTCKSVAATRNAAGLVDAFAVFGDGSVWEFAHPSAPTLNWVALGGSATGPIAAGLEAGGAEQVAVVGKDGGLWLRWLDTRGDMTAWYGAGGGPFQAVSVAANSAGLVDTFVTLADGTVQEYAHTAPQSFGWVTNLNGGASAVAAGTDALGRDLLFAVGFDGSLWLRTQTAPGSW